MYFPISLDKPNNLVYNNPCRIKSALGHHKRWRLLPIKREVSFLFVLPVKREVMRMYITLEQLIEVLILLITFGDVVYRIVSDNKKK